MQRSARFFFSSRRRHTRYWRDWSSDVCSSDLAARPSHRAAGLVANLIRPSRGGHVLQAFAAAFRTPDLRRKLLFSLAIIAVYRLGAAIPGPGVSVEAINKIGRASCRERV